MTRTPAPALTEGEAAIVARFDAAPTPPEVVVIHTVADAMHRAICDCGSGAIGTDWQMAVAAIAALDPSGAAEGEGR